MVATNAEAEAVAAAEAEAEMGQKRKKTKEVSYALAGRRNMCAAVCTLVSLSVCSAYMTDGCLAEYRLLRSRKGTVFGVCFWFALAD